MNSSILKRDFPYCYREFINLKGHEATNFKNAIDNLLMSFGLNMIVSPVYSHKSDKVVGYISKLRIHDQNQWSLDGEDINVIRDFDTFKDYLKAQAKTIIFSLEFLEKKL